MKQSEARSAIVKHVESALASALGSMTGKEFSVAAGGNSQEDDEAGAIVWGQAFSFNPEPVFWLAAAKDFWTAIGQLTLGEGGIDSVTEDDCRSAWQEIAGQAMGALASSITIDAHQEITARKGQDAESPSDISWTVFAVNYNESPTWFLKAAWSQALLDVYEQLEPADKISAGKDSTFSKTFELLLDVALPVSVSFGKTLLQIREVLKLNSGSIVELNRFVAEPVDVVVNDCVIARGEVVVVDGNYGVRITQLASREDRLRSGMANAPLKLEEAVR